MAKTFSCYLTNLTYKLNHPNIMMEVFLVKFLIYIEKSGVPKQVIRGSRSVSEYSKIFVTGANGFVGSFLCDEAEKRGLSVKRGVRKIGSNFSKEMNYFEVGDLSIQTKGIRVDLENIDVVIHAAAIAHKYDIDDPLRAYRNVNVRGTENLIRECHRAGVKRFVYISSVKAAGESSDGIGFKFSGNERPEDHYGVSKLEAEASVKSMCSEYNIEYVIIRPPLVYGPGVKANFLNLIRLVDLNLPLPFLSIKNKRSYLYIGNLVDAILLASHHPRAVGEVFYLSDEVPLALPELIKLIGKSLKKSTRLTPFPLTLMEFLAKCFGRQHIFAKLAGSLVVSSSHARKLMDWKPKFSTLEGLLTTVKWYESGKPHS